MIPKKMGKMDCDDEGRVELVVPWPRVRINDELGRLRERCIVVLDRR
jgi:hypothetical protein